MFTEEKARTLAAFIREDLGQRAAIARQIGNGEWVVYIMREASGWGSYYAGEYVCWKCQDWDAYRQLDRYKEKKRWMLQ